LNYYKIKKFASEANKENVLDSLLFDTLNGFLNLERDAQQKYALGAGLFKLRLASKEGRGKSGGSRSILAFKKDRMVIWLHLFSKNDKSNVLSSELKKLKKLSDVLLELSGDNISKLIELGELFEVNKNE
jgi:hypothetical protein